MDVPRSFGAHSGRDNEIVMNRASPVTNERG